jgi:hypothetical protein
MTPRHLAIAAAALLLAGCSAGGFDASPAPMAPSPTPTAAEGDYSDGTLFVIQASTTAVDGTAVQLTMTGYATQAAGDRPELAERFIGDCGALGGGTVMNADATLSAQTLADYGSTLMVIDTVSEPADVELAGAVELQLGNPFYYVVASGDGLSNPYAHSCYGGYQIGATGSVSSLTNYETGSPTPDLAQWRSGRYGFLTAFDSSAVLSDCAIELSPLAVEAQVADIDGWFSDGGSDTECAIGYRGE